MSSNNEGWIVDGFLRAAPPELVRALSKVDLIDLNVLMYRTDAEERNACGADFGVYVVPGAAELPYCGIEGAYQLVRVAAEGGELGGAICNHLRSGLWLPNYLVCRIQRCE